MEKVKNARSDGKIQFKETIKNNQIKMQEMKIIIKEMRIAVERVTGRLNAAKGKISENFKVDQ